MKENLLLLKDSLELERKRATRLKYDLWTLRKNESSTMKNVSKSNNARVTISMMLLC